MVATELTEREMEIMRLIASGASTKEIARALHISLHTVKNHVDTVLKKTNSHNRVQAIGKLWAQLNSEVS